MLNIFAPELLIVAWFFILTLGLSIVILNIDLLYKVYSKFLLFTLAVYAIVFIFVEYYLFTDPYGIIVFMFILVAYPGIVLLPLFIIFLVLNSRSRVARR